LIGRRILKIGSAKPALRIGSVVVLWERLGDYHRRWWPGSVVKECGVEKCSETALSTSALEVMLMLPPLHLFIKQEARLQGNGFSYVPNFGHSEVLLRMTDETPLLLAPRDKFVTLSKLRILVGLITGYCPLNKHLHNMGFIDEPI
jgi:hypothetical protein